MGLTFVWFVGIILSLVTFRFAISGKVSSVGIPGWLITLTVLVGIWQWVWLERVSKMVSASHQVLTKEAVKG